MHQRSTGELLTRAAFMHHADQGSDALKHYAALKGLKTIMANQWERTQRGSGGRWEALRAAGID